MSCELIEWCDRIVVMERVHHSRLKAMFPKELQAKRVIVLGIPDRYDFMDPELVLRLRTQLAPFLSGESIQTRDDLDAPRSNVPNAASMKDE